MKIQVQITAALMAFLLTSPAFAVCSSSPPEQDKVPDPIVITDTLSWKHPVKKILVNYKVKLYKVELTKCRKYPIFYVSLPYDPQSSQSTDYFHKLYTEVLAANGWWNYAFYDEEDHIKIEVEWDKKKKSMSINFVELARQSS